jgi:hypothetical protein
MAGPLLPFTGNVASKNEIAYARLADATPHIVLSKTLDEEEVLMIRMFVRHDVSDYTTWRRHYDGFDAERRTMGVRGDAVYLAADNRNDVTVTHDFDTLQAAQAFASSPRLREVMAGAGVVGKPTIWFTSQA